MQYGLKQPDNMLPGTVVVRRCEEVVFEVRLIVLFGWQVVFSSPSQQDAEKVAENWRGYIKTFRAGPGELNAQSKTPANAQLKFPADVDVFRAICSFMGSDSDSPLLSLDDERIEWFCEEVRRRNARRKAQGEANDAR